MYITLWKWCPLISIEGPFILVIGLNLDKLTNWKINQYESPSFTLVTVCLSRFKYFFCQSVCADKASIHSLTRIEDNFIFD